MLDPVKNFSKCEVSTLYSDTDTSIVLSSGEGAKLPQPSTDGAFNLVWWNFTDYKDPSDDPNVEIVRCTARSTDTLTVTRAQEDTSASTKNTSGKIYKMILSMTKKVMTDINDSLFRVETPSGTVDGSNTEFTTTNTPKFIIVDGIIYFTGNGFTYLNPTITVDSVIAPTQFIRSIY